MPSRKRMESPESFQPWLARPWPLSSTYLIRPSSSGVARSVSQDVAARRCGRSGAHLVDVHAPAPRVVQQADPQGRGVHRAPVDRGQAEVHGHVLVCRSAQLVGDLARGLRRVGVTASCPDGGRGRGACPRRARSQRQHHPRRPEESRPKSVRYQGVPAAANTSRGSAGSLSSRLRRSAIDASTSLPSRGSLASTWRLSGQSTASEPVSAGKWLSRRRSVCTSTSTSLSEPGAIERRNVGQHAVRAHVEMVRGGGEGHADRLGVRVPVSGRSVARGLAPARPIPVAQVGLEQLAGRDAGLDRADVRAVSAEPDHEWGIDDPGGAGGHGDPFAEGAAGQSPAAVQLDGGVRPGITETAGRGEELAARTAAGVRHLHELRRSEAHGEAGDGPLVVDEEAVCSAPPHRPVRLAEGRAVAVDTDGQVVQPGLLAHRLRRHGRLCAPGAVGAVRGHGPSCSCSCLRRVCGSDAPS